MSEPTSPASTVASLGPRETREPAEEAGSSSSDEEEEVTYLGSVEAEAWLMAALVSDGARGSTQRHAVRIPDTVLFKEGKPVCWLFTDRRGRLRRKRVLQCIKLT